ncbi:hypothetical protein EJ04DRAFT_517131 [Polyplosphaeria fusca]|uniref:Extracellular mutant protein 11 C-terminal domain-containing protein n=1 Tax=Polyplosphaeria fusca TaxID=682080 RepID=A0A9P4QMF3_9PLEO|nr:hypothetical protein EJ04DRAFT_517131 [Polyplosphaeria fusca]
MLQRGAKIRNQERQQPLVSSSQPLTYSQTDRPHNSQPGPSHQFNVAHHGNYASPKEPPRGTGQLLHAYPARVRSSAQPRPTERFVQAPPSPTSADAEVHIEPVNKGAIEDYEHSELIQMSFERLKNERFDTDPRAETHVLSEDMLSKPLKDRLHHVQKSLDAGDQTKFFSSLPTDEWEDAGDWFLDQFQGLVNRAKIARQNKRKLAMDFEAEVEKRHYHVVKRQRTVDGALEKMHQKGLGLLPKSPTPVRQMNKKQSNGRE